MLCYIKLQLFGLPTAIFRQSRHILRILCEILFHDQHMKIHKFPFNGRRVPESEQYFPLKWPIFTRRNNLDPQKISISSGARAKFYHLLFKSISIFSILQIFHFKFRINNFLSHPICAISKFIFKILA